MSRPPRLLALGASASLLSLVLVTATGASTSTSSTSTTTSLVTTTTTGATTTATPQACDAATLSQWPLSQLVNQTIVVSVNVAQVAQLSSAARAGYGGILLFGDTAPSNLAEILGSLRAQVPDNLGLLVMTDEEGGQVERLTNIVGSWPWARTLSKRSPAAIAALAQRIAERLSAAGVNVDLAPVLDVDPRAVVPSNRDADGLRSFSGNDRVVAIDGEAFLKGLTEGGVLGVVKHFPGLGGSSANTDDGPAKTLPWATLSSQGLFPFHWAVRNGATAVMISNASVPGLTTLPASLSSVVIQQVLRTQLGFTGLVLPDSLSAGAISDLHLSVPQASVEALEAGNDMVLYGQPTQVVPSLALAQSIAATITKAVSQGSISTTQLIGADLHVLAAKGITSCPS